MIQDLYDSFKNRKTEILYKTEAESIYPSHQKMIEYCLNLCRQQHYLKIFEITDSFPFPFLLDT